MVPEQVRVRCPPEWPDRRLRPDDLPAERAGLAEVLGEALADLTDLTDLADLADLAGLPLPVAPAPPARPLAADAGPPATAPGAWPG